MESTDTRGSTHSSLLIQDLSEGLVWPRLIRAGGLALRPDRIGLGVVIVVLLGLIERIGLLWHNQELEGAFTGLASSISEYMSDAPILTSSGEDVIGRVIYFFEHLARLPMTVVQSTPLLSMLLLGPIMLLVWAIFGGAISRGVMSEVSLAKVPSWPETLASAMRRWSSLLGALLVPLVFIAGCWSLIAIFGLGFHVPVLGEISSLLFGVGIVIGLVATLVLVAYAIGGWMLVPAVMAEGTDALDGVQRSLAYVLSRPLRSVLYLVILTVVGLVAVGIAGWFGELSISFATRAAATWGPVNGTGTLQAMADAENGEGGMAGTVLAFWSTLVTVIVAGYAVSYIHTAGALQYLCLRFVCDGQEIGELWEEGM